MIYFEIVWFYCVSLKMLKFDLENSEALNVVLLLMSFVWLILFSCRWSTYLPVKRIISPQSKRCLNWSLLLLWPSSSKVGMLGTTSCRGRRKSCGFDIFSVTVSSCLHVSVFKPAHTETEFGNGHDLMKWFLFSEMVWWLLILLFCLKFSPHEFHTCLDEGRFHTRDSDLDPNAFGPVYTWYLQSFQVIWLIDRWVSSASLLSGTHQDALAFMLQMHLNGNSIIWP